MTNRSHLVTAGMLVLVLVAMACAAGAQPSGESYQYIDIRNPFLRKIPLAVPLFKNLTGGTL